MWDALCLCGGRDATPISSFLYSSFTKITFIPYWFDVVSTPRLATLTVIRSTGWGNATRFPPSLTAICLDRDRHLNRRGCAKTAVSALEPLTRLEALSWCGSLHANAIPVAAMARLTRLILADAVGLDVDALVTTLAASPACGTLVALNIMTFFRAPPGDGSRPAHGSKPDGGSWIARLAAFSGLRELAVVVSSDDDRKAFVETLTGGGTALKLSVLAINGWRGPLRDLLVPLRATLTALLVVNECKPDEWETTVAALPPRLCHLDVAFSESCEAEAAAATILALPELQSLVLRRLNEATLVDAILGVAREASGAAGEAAEAGSNGDGEKDGKAVAEDEMRPPLRLSSRVNDLNGPETQRLRASDRFGVGSFRVGVRWEWTAGLVVEE